VYEHYTAENPYEWKDIETLVLEARQKKNPEASLISFPKPGPTIKEKQDD
jgi:hypothetical protein